MQARSARQSGKLSDAKSELEKALDIAPDQKTTDLVHGDLAEVLQLLGDSAGAQEHRAASSPVECRYAKSVAPGQADIFIAAAFACGHNGTRSVH